MIDIQKNFCLIKSWRILCKINNFNLRFQKGYFCYFKSITLDYLLVETQFYIVFVNEIINIILCNIHFILRFQIEIFCDVRKNFYQIEIQEILVSKLCEINEFIPRFQIVIWNFCCDLTSIIMKFVSLSWTTAKDIRQDLEYYFYRLKETWPFYSFNKVLLISSNG